MGWVVVSTGCAPLDMHGGLQEEQQASCGHAFEPWKCRYQGDWAEGMTQCVVVGLVPGYSRLFPPWCWVGRKSRV